MLRKVFLSLAVLAAFAFTGTSSAEAGGCYRGGGGFYPSYRAAGYYGGPSYYRRSFYGRPSVYRSYYGGPGYYGYYPRPRSGVGLYIGW